jgi:hypothetical protein
MDGKSEIRTVSDVLQKADIALDSYDDIFSDFDPSPYERRLLSEDLISELRRRHAASGKGELVVNFTLPKALRNEKTEALIKKRIKEHFRSRLRELEKLRRDKTRYGAILILLGVAFSALLIVFPMLDVVPFVTLFSVLIWYALWSGFDHVFETAHRMRKKISFAEKFTKAEYNFFPQEAVIETMQKLQGAEVGPKTDAPRAEQEKAGQKSETQRAEPKS